MAGHQFLKATPDQLRAMLRFLDIRVYDDAYIDDFIQWVRNGEKYSATPGQVITVMQVRGKPR